MRDVESIDKDIEELKSRMASVRGTPTEVYTRIVGYYRSLTNWNKGKREEYDKRRTFEHDRTRPAAAVEPGGDGGEARTDRDATGAAHVPGPSTGTAAAVGGEAGSGTAPAGAAVAEREETRAPAGLAVDDTAPASYVYFFRPSCPNCPPVRTLLEASELEGRGLDVDTEEGFEWASHMQILATPTVVFFDGEGRTVGRATAPTDVREYLSLAG